MYENHLGLVSNCWKMQLDVGESLSSLIARAVDVGFRFVELRQGCLGECENPETRLPHVDELVSLASKFHEVTFDLAVELPVFSSPVTVASSDVRTMLDAAHALSDASRPAHLRIVDLVSKQVPRSRVDDAQHESGFFLEDAITSLQELQNELAAGVVSVEHSYQPWSGFRRLFEATRSTSGDANSSGPMPRLCYDPCNLWISGDGESANEITETLPVEWLSMVHLKQRCGGAVSTRFEPGEVDWSRQLAALNRAGYAGPFLFETAPTEDVWQCLADSRRYLAEV
jgi:sugar phosphate isomerase/epimerase